MERTLVRETDKYAIFNISYGGSHSNETKEKKFLCIGGPFAGEYKSWSQIYDLKYHSFNSSGGNPGHTMVYIHKSILQPVIETVH